MSEKASEMKGFEILYILMQTWSEMLKFRTLMNCKDF